jgi:hypothetical protein
MGSLFVDITKGFASFFFLPVSLYFVFDEKSTRTSGKYYVNRIGVVRMAID